MFYRFSLYGFLKNLRLFEPFLILFFRFAGLSYTQIGILYATQMLSTNLFEIPTGVYADAFGRRKSMVMAFFSYILAFSIFYFFSNFYLFLFAMVLYGLGDAYRSGTHKAMILEYLKIKGIEDKKVEYYGSTRSASQFGSAINSLLAAGVVFYTGNYRAIFIVTIIPYILDFINLATYPKYLDGEIKKSKKIKEQIKLTLRDFVNIFKNREALRAMLNSSSFDSGFSSTKDYLQPILKSFALSIPIFLFLSGSQRTAVVIGLIYFILYLLSSYASKNSYKIVKRFRKITMAINITLLIGTLSILFAGLSYYLTLSLISILLFIGIHILHNIRRPMNVAYISDRISSRVMASGLSVESQLKMIIASIFAFLLGVFADMFGVGIALFIIGLIILSIIPFVLVRDKNYNHHSNTHP